MLEYLICELSSTWKSTSGSADDYYNKIYDGLKNKISESELIYKNKYKYLTDIGIEMIKNKKTFISLNNYEKINENEYLVFLNKSYKEINNKNYTEVIKDITDYIVNYINNRLEYDDINKIYYLNKSPVGCIDHCLPVYVNLNKDFLKKYNNTLFK